MTTGARRRAGAPADAGQPAGPKPTRAAWATSCSPASARSSAATRRAPSLWQQAAGAGRAPRSQAAAFARGTLTVACESSVWAQELTYLGGRILSVCGALDAGRSR